MFNLSALFNLIPFMEDLSNATSEVPSIDTSAVDTLFNYIKGLLETPLFTYGGISITVGVLLLAFLKWFFPKDKYVAVLESENKKLKEENANLKTEVENTEARVQTLEAKMDVVTANTPNKKVRDAYYIKVKPNQIFNRYESYSSKDVKGKKKIKVKVKKHTDNIQNQIQESVTQVATDMINEVKDVITNGN